MATVTVAAPAGRRRALRRILFAVLVLLLLSLALLLGWFYLVNRWALPQVDGSAALPGISAPVTVLRDARGMPHIRAANVLDAVMAQGYVTAQDRLWEMDMLRRDGGGELAEILGPSALKRDEQQHTLGTQQIAQRALAAMPADNRAFLEAYARGVNAFIESHRSSLPLEFRVLAYRPRPWRAEDSLLVGISMGEMLNFGYIRDMLAREKVTAKVGSQLAADLYPITSWRDIPPSASASPLKELPKPPPIPETRYRPADGAPRLPGFGRTLECGILCSGDDLRAGSNDWVVSGALTASGKPMLSNDMHLPHQIPNIWYQAHLTAGDFDVAGVSLPGVPFIIVGHNRRIAWGFTNLNPQVTDLYIETFNDKGDYQTPEGWKPAGHRRETIHIKGRPDEALDVVSTRHGPIISAQLPGETRQIALQATMFDPAALQFPFSMVDAAQNWDEFRAAFSHFGLPGQNVVYADVDGHIGYQATGFVPIRKATAGGLPVPGNDDAHEWTGYIPFDQMPRVLDPPSGVLATANGRITPDGYPLYISDEWEAPFRTDRIYHVLQSGKKLGAADMLALQTDVYSDYDRFCAQRMVYAVDHEKNASARARQAADLLRQWDGRLTTDSAAAVIETRARGEFVNALLRPKLGELASEYHWPMMTAFVENVLLHQPARWLPPAAGSIDAVLAQAVEKAVTSANAPRDLSRGKWGEASPVELRHMLFGRLPLLKYFSGPGLRPQSGGRYTVKQVGRTFGPSERLTVDFSDLDHSTLNIVNGQTDNLLSEHFDDQWSAWYEGRTFALPFSAAAVDAARVHTLTLRPSPKP